MNKKSEKAKGVEQFPHPRAKMPQGSTPLENFRASRPDVAELQDALKEQIRKAIADFRKPFRNMVSTMVDTAELGRQIGIAIVELEDTLCGRKLTEDFWRQMQDLHVDSCGQPISRGMLQWFAKIARNQDKPITEPIEAHRQLKLVLRASGEPEFNLSYEKPPQKLHLPANPLSLLKERLSASLKEEWEAFKRDPNCWQNGRLRADLKATLAAAWRETFELLDEIREHLGI